MIEPAPSRWRRRGALLALAATLTAMALASLWPLTASYWHQNHDMVAYPVRALEYVGAWRSGALWPRWAFDLYAGYGCAFFNFYAPGLFAVAGVPLLLGASVGVALKLALLAYTLAAVTGMFGFVWSETRRADAALLATVLYVVYPYHSTLLFVRGDLAEYCAGCVAPLVLWAYRALGRAPGSRVVAVGCSAAALHAATLLTHTITGQWLTELLLIYVVIAAVRTWRGGDRWRALTLLVVFGCACGLTAIYALPALLERPLVHIERMTEGGLATVRNFIDAAWMTSPGFFFVGRAFYLMPLVVIAACIRRRRFVVGPFVMMLAALGLAAATVRFAMPLWRWLPFAEYIQFPWRLLGFVGLFSALAWGLAAAELLPERRAIAWPLVIVLAIAATWDARRGPPLDYHPMTAAEVPGSTAQIAREWHTTVISDEYLPRGVAKPTPKPGYVLRQDRAVVELALRSGLGYKLDVGGEAGSTVDLHAIYFPGWKVETRSGPARALIGASPVGLVRVTLPQKGYYNLRVTFALTPLRLVATLLSWLSLAFLVGSLWWLMRRLRPPGAAA
jgi:hypothetical protein